MRVKSAQKEIKFIYFFSLINGFTSTDSQKLISPIANAKKIHNLGMLLKSLVYKKQLLCENLIDI